MQTGRVILWFCLSWGFGVVVSAAESKIDFNRDIRPILAQNCFACHGPDAAAREADLRLDSAEGATLMRAGERAVSPGQPEASLLIERIESDAPETLMPPPDSGHRLTDREKRLLRDWIATGANYDIHWSFLPPIKAQPPHVGKHGWPRHPLDHFILARLESEELAPAAEVDRYRYLRRVSLDLTGLPPTPEEADTFVADASNHSFEKVVDRLLDSEAYGEHWARMWLDLARYADTKGYEKDRPREIWRYRDWVIDAFNADMPFDQFTIEQLAGDLLEKPTNEQYIATAFHRNTMTNEEGGTDDEEFRVAAVKDRVDTTMQVWMGLTMGCAKCHSHKFDPISQHDYYSFLAFFNQTEDTDRGDEAPILPTPTADESRKIRDSEQLVAKLSATLSAEGRAATSTAKQVAADNIVPNLQARLDSATQQLAKLRKGVATTPVMRDLALAKQRKTRVHLRGNFLDPGALVTPNVPTLFGAFPPSAPPNRRGVAEWLLQPNNPLTARVIVNRIWARLFGIGIVETEEDFGSQGTPPLHPQLLDWLAVDLRENHWSLKQLIRSLVLSATYRQSSQVSTEKRSADPQNRLLSRGPRFRLPAETIRDQTLAISGLLTRQLGGPSVMPPQPAGVWKTTYSALSWEDAKGPDRYRRALYTYWKRTSPYPAMTTFDAGSGEVCQMRRVRTNTPLQALVTLNDPAYVEAAAALAKRMAEASPFTSDAALQKKLERGFRLTLTRKPTEREMQRLSQLYHELERDLGNDESQAIASSALGEEPHDAAMVVVANVLLNLDETLMKP